jgi:hypothetical protein
MKKSNYVIIGAVIIAAIFFFKNKAAKKIVSIPTPIPVSVYPAGITEGMRVVASNGDGTQFLIQNGKKYGITLEQWTARGFDPYVIIDSRILDLVPNGGLLNAGA